jgi:6-pyruvoyl tetrahydropterin synthase/QueD family protein
LTAVNGLSIKLDHDAVEAFIPFLHHVQLDKHPISGLLNDYFDMNVLLYLIQDSGIRSPRSLYVDVKALNIKRRSELYFHMQNALRLSSVGTDFFGDEGYAVFNEKEICKIKEATQYSNSLHSSNKYMIESHHTWDSPIMEVTKTIDFDSAHFLEDHPGKCKNLHGGRYELQVTVKGEVNPKTGMVIDYTFINFALKNIIKNKLDHHFINDAAQLLRYRSTTELMCIWIWSKLINYFPEMTSIRLYETPTSYCDYTGKPYEELQAIYNPDLAFVDNVAGIKNDYIGIRPLSTLNKYIPEYLRISSTMFGVVTAMVENTENEETK